MLRALSLLCLLACAHPAAPAPPALHRVPPVVWTTLTLDDNGYRCEPPWLMPATYCGRRSELFYTGCEWVCGPRDVSEDSQ